MAYLIDGDGNKYPLKDDLDTLIVGREGDLKIPNRYKAAGVSKKHAKLFHDRVNKKWSITDVESKFGTYVNTDKIEPDDEYKLADGNIVRLGNYPMVFRDNASEDVPIGLAEPATDK